MRAPFLRCLPAVVAVLVIALFSGCAATRLPHALAEAAPIVHVPTSPADISGIHRGAGEIAGDPSQETAVWGYLGLLAVMAVLFVVYGIIWCGMQLYDLVDDSLAEPADDDEHKAVVSQ